MSVSIFLKKQRVIVLFPDNEMRQYEPDGDLQAVNGAASETITIKFTENNKNIIADYPFDEILDESDAAYDSTRDDVRDKLNADVFNAALEPTAVGITVKNNVSAVLPKGTPVYVSGYDSSSRLPMVAGSYKATPGTMPATFILNEDLAASGTGEALLIGTLSDIDTSSFSVGDELYVNEANLSSTIPTGTNTVQSVGFVLESHATTGKVSLHGLGMTTQVSDDLTPQLGGDLDVNGKNIVSSSDGDIVLDPNGTGSIVLKADNVKMEGASGTSVSSLKFFEFGILEGNYIALKAPFSVASDLTFTLPATDGSTGQVLKTNGSAALGWQDALSGVNDTLTGVTQIKDAGTTRGTVSFYDDAGDNFVALRGATTLTSDTVFILPTEDGNSGQFLQTDGSGNMSWASPMLPIANVSGRFMWSSADDGERVYTGSSVYGPYNFYSHSVEPTVAAIRDYSGSEVVGSTTASIIGYKVFTHGIKNPYAGKKVRVDYSFRIYYSGSSAPTAGTPFGFSVWSGNAPATGSTSSATVTYRGESDDHAMVAAQQGGTSAHHHGSFTTSTTIDDDYLLVLAEHRDSTGINGTTYMVANYNVYLTD